MTPRPIFNKLTKRSNGVGASRAVRIFKTYGHDAIQVMTEDPYRLARDIKGVGFRTADAIAMKMGMTREAPQRVRAGVLVRSPGGDRRGSLRTPRRAPRRTRDQTPRGRQDDREIGAGS